MGKCGCFLSDFGATVRVGNSSDGNLKIILVPSQELEGI